MAIGMKLGAANEGFSVDTIIKTRIVPASIAKIGGALVEISAAGRNQRSMSIFGAFGDDIDDGINGISSPNGSTRAPNDFDPLNILGQCVLDLQIAPCEQGRVNAGH